MVDQRRFSGSGPGNDGYDVRRMDRKPPLGRKDLRQRHPFVWIGLGFAGLALFGVVAIFDFERLKSVLLRNLTRFRRFTGSTFVSAWKSGVGLKKSALQRI